MYIFSNNKFEGFRSWTSIFLWGFGIALLIFTLTWLRIGYLDPYLNDSTDAIFFFLPHFFIALWGITIGLSFNNNKKLQISPIRYSFFSVLFVTFFFGIIVLLWRAVVDPIDGKSYTENILAFLFSDSTYMIPFFWIVTPFFIGYVFAKTFQYMYDYVKN